MSDCAIRATAFRPCAGNQGDGHTFDIQDGNHVTLQNGATFAAGKVAQGLSFDGVNDYARVAAAANLNVGTSTGFTMEAWIRPDDNAARAIFEYNNESARAQYKGFGTINGSGNYRFMLTAIDGQSLGGGGHDKFRIKIWSDGGGLVYDNQMNDPDSNDPTTVLGGGSIVIHR
jgi:hypothetical protein